jgi:hypothetical protein
MVRSRSAAATRRGPQLAQFRVAHRPRRPTWTVRDGGSLRGPGPLALDSRTGPAISLATGPPAAVAWLQSRSDESPLARCLRLTGSRCHTGRAAAGPPAGGAAAFGTQAGWRPVPPVQ